MAEGPRSPQFPRNRDSHHALHANTCPRPRKGKVMEWGATTTLRRGFGCRLYKRGYPRNHPRQYRKKDVPATKVAPTGCDAGTHCQINLCPRCMCQNTTPQQMPNGFNRRDRGGRRTSREKKHGQPGNIHKSKQKRGGASHSRPVTSGQRELVKFLEKSWRGPANSGEVRSRKQASVTERREKS